VKRDERLDLNALAKEFYDRLQIDDCEYGGIGLDSKRPFGNSDADADILEIIGWEPEGDDGSGPCWSSEQREYASDLYHEKLIPYLRKRFKETQ
jgi:hypothetical protein